VEFDKNILKDALNIIKEDETGKYRSGNWVSLSTILSINASYNKELIPESRLMRYIDQDLWNIETMCEKVDWVSLLFTQNVLNEMQYMRFIQTDLDSFLIEIRSIFDYISKILTILSQNPKQVRGEGESFNKLFNWLSKKKTNLGIFGEDLGNLVLCCDWFYDIKDLRDDKTHRGANTLIFPNKNEILFQVYKGWEKQVEVNEIMFNENVVNFRRYAGLIIGYLYNYLEIIAKTIEPKIKLKTYGADFRSYHPGLKNTHKWISVLLS
jgi:hypothetical protein